MRRIFSVFVLFMVFTITACTEGAVPTLDTIDHHLHRDDVQYVELREWVEVAEHGMIDGFEVIPFYGVIVDSGYLMIPRDGRFHPSNIVNESAIRNLFDADKTIYLICRTGNRTTFMTEVLTHLGYDVVNLGGIVDYHGDNLIFP